MKANYKNIAAALKTALLVSFLGLQSCGTYNGKTTIESDLYSGDFEKASKGVDENKFLKKDRNRLLFLMEKGKIEHLRGNYEKSNALFEQAYIMIDDKISTNVGQAIAAKLTNPMTEPYKGEDFEKVTIHYYMALNYFQLGMPNEALVEAKRINLKLYELNEKYNNNKNKYSEDAFSQILQGLLYEATGDINNAFIAYRNAEEIYSRNGGNFFGTPMPEQLKKDLLRTAWQMGFRDEYDKYLQKFSPQTTVDGKKMTPPPPPALRSEGEAVIFWENGLGPAKDQIIITATDTGLFFYGTWMEDGVVQDIWIPIPTGTDFGSINAIAIPKYNKRPSYYSNASVIVNGKEQMFNLAQDFYPIAKQCLKDRMLRETIDLVLRFAAKKAAGAGLQAGAKALFGDDAGDLVGIGADVAGAATEKADTRNWQSLPQTISYARVPLQPGDNKFTIKKYGPDGVVDTDTLTIPFKRGLQLVNYYDLGRTQVLPAAVSQNLTTKLGELKAMDNTAKSSSTGQYTPSEPVSVRAGGARIRPVEAGITVNTIIDKYILAAGGEEKLKGIKTTFIRSTIYSVFNGQSATVETLVKTTSANDSYTQVSSGGKVTMTSVVNADGGFFINDGKRTKMDNTTYKMLRATGALYENYTLPLRSNDAKVEGVTVFTGEDAYVVSFTEPASKTPMKNYYSTTSGLLIGTSADFSSGGVSFSMKNTFSDYRKVNGIMYPFKTANETNEGTSETIVNELKFNEGVFDADFK